MKKYWRVLLVGICALGCGAGVLPGEDQFCGSDMHCRDIWSDCNSQPNWQSNFQNCMAGGGYQYPGSGFNGS